MKDTASFLENQIFIGGAFLDAGSGGEMEHFYPATGQVNGKVRLGGGAEVERAVAAAKAGLVEWEAMGPIERRQCLGRLADLVEAWEAQFQALAAAEMGIPQQGFQGRHRFAVEWIRTYQGWADKIGGDVTAMSDAGRFEYTRLEPFGVVGVILTWNSPLLSLTMKVPAALAAGNAVVVKPSELTPYTPILFARACQEAGIPNGVVNIIPGGIEAGEAIVAHPDVEKISFTGGLKAATAMMRSGAPLVKPFCFELGGKSAHLVFADADLALAAKVVIGGLSNAGQSCTFGSRIYVHDSVYDAFKENFLSQIGRIVVGDPADERTTMGPLVTAGARDRVLSFVEQAVSDRQGKLLFGGKAPVLEGALAGGYFVQPTVFDGADAASPLMKEEIFGPVFSMQRFTDEESAVRYTNDTDLGLCNYVHTHDLRRALRVTSQLKSGTVYVNDASRRNAGAPFGGWRRSGIGSEGGRPGLEEFLRRKTVGLF
jgi:aldehyde dehydrogenase (NAD+)